MEQQFIGEVQRGAERSFTAVRQQEVNSGRADLITIMYFALFILEQLKEEVDTMMSGALKQRWVGGSC